MESLMEIMSFFSDEKTALDFLVQKRWNGNITCPHCNSNKIYTFKDKTRYKCGSCLKQFTAKVGTIFEGSKIPLRKWFIAMYLLTSHKKGFYSYHLARDLNITQKLDCYILHHIRNALSRDIILRD